MKIFLWLPLFFGSLILHAQRHRAFENQFIKNEQLDATLVISFSPLATLQIDNTLMAGAEYKLNENFNVALEAGYIFYSSYFIDNANQLGVSGFNMRPSVKFFLSDSRTAYFQTQFFYKQATHVMYDWLDKDLVNGVPTYQQLQEFKHRRKVHGYNFIFGTTRSLGFRSRLLADVYLGLGMRYKWSSIVGEKNSRYNRGPNFFFRNEREGTSLPSLPFGIRLLYMLD